MKKLWQYDIAKDESGCCEICACVAEWQSLKLDSGLHYVICMS